MNAGVGRAVSFKTHVYITGDSEDRIPDVVIQRMLSLAIVQTLDGEELEEAYEYLVDSYNWWAKPSLALADDSRKTVVSKPVMRRKKAESLDLHEA